MMRAKPWRSVNTKLSLIVLLLLAAFALIGARTIATSRELILTQADVLGRALSGAAAVFCTEPLLAHDYPVLEAYMESLTREKEDVVFARVEHMDGRVAAEFPRAFGGAQPQSVRLYQDSIRVRASFGERAIGRVVLGISTSRAEASVAARSRDLLVSFAVSFSTAAALLWFSLRRIVARPLATLRDHGLRLSRGEFDAPVRVETGDEFGVLANTLDGMRESLRAREEELRKLNASLKAQNEVLADALERSRAAERVKSEFVANVSHELRTPLNTIVNVPDGLLELFVVTVHCAACKSSFDASGDETVDAATKCPGCGVVGTLEKSGTVSTATAPERLVRGLVSIRRAGAYLLELVSAILDFSKLEANKADLVLANVSVREIFDDVRNMLAPVAARTRVSLHFANGKPDIVLRADRVKLTQVIVNLVGNAIKFSKEGGRVDIGAERGDGDIVFSVRDQGIGIPASEHRAIFESFRQVEAGHTRRFGGTGLGLAITERLVMLHGGTIGVESAPDRGSTFTVRLPEASARATLDG